VTVVIGAVAALLLGGAVAGRPQPPARAVRPARGTADPPAADRRRRGRDAATPDALATLPDLVDLLGVAAAAGLPPLPAVVAVAERAPAPWRAPLLAAVAEAGQGRRAVDALHHLRSAHGDLARPLAAVLRAGLDDGDAFVPGLAALAADTRDLRRRRAEEAARRIPVRLLLPLVLCSLPAAAVLTIVPIVAGALDGLRFPT
jgi:tight adherence protein C